MSRRVYNDLKQVLIMAQKMRPWLSVPNPNDHGMMAWIEFERLTMLLAVNKFRLKKGLQPATVEQIIRVESLASGHVDYTTKYALGCEELVMDK